MTRQQPAGDRQADAVDSAPVLLWTAGLDSGFTWVNAAWRHFSGAPFAAHLGDAWTEQLHADDRDRIAGAYRFAFDARETFECEARLRRADGRFRWMLIRGAPRLEDFDFTGFAGSCTDITDLHNREQSALLLADICAIAPQGTDVDETLQRIAELVVPDFADLCSIGLRVSDGRVRRAAIAHVDAGESARLRALGQRYPLRREDGSALAEVAATGATLYRPIVDAPGPDEPWPNEDEPGTERSLIVSPLPGRDGVSGACAMVTWNRHYTRDDVALVEEVAQRCAVVADTTRMYRESESARTRLALLARIGEALGSALEVVDTSHRVLDLVVPAIADFGLVALGEHPEYERVDVRHVDRAVETRFRDAYLGEELDLDSATPLARAIHTAAPVLIETVPAEARGRNGGEALASMRALGARSVLAAPLVTDGHVLGAIVLGYGPSERQYSPADVPLVLDIARRLALGVERARAYVAERQVAETLQRSLLPHELPDVPTMELCARYLPGDRATVGGDWFDVVALSEGKLGVVIGDVAGHGVRAAAVMGQLRNALRAFLGEGYQPAEMVERLNRFMFENGPSDMATLCFAAIDPGSGHVIAVSAGHPPSVVWRANGEVTWLAGVSGPPIGADPRARYRALETTLSAGDALVMYTDGLVERRRESLDDGLARLLDAVAANPPGARLDTMCDGLTAALLVDQHADDDVALLAVRYVGNAPGALRWHRPARASELSGMRRRLRSWLEDAAIAREDINPVLVAVNEAATNAIEHAYGRREGWFEVDGRLQDDELTVVVRDAGQWRPKAAGGGGRGLVLIGRLMDEFELRRSNQGTEVWMRRHVGRSDT